jgi:ankyrin repeat protein
VCVFWGLMLDPTEFSDMYRSGDTTQCKMMLNCITSRITDVNSQNQVDEALIFSCSQGYVDMSIMLLEKFPTIDMRVSDELPFRTSCAHGHLKLSKLLLKLSPSINISARDEYAFRFSCRNGKLLMSQWLLLEVMPTLNISAIDEYAFRLSCRNGHREMSKWILEMKPTLNISALDDWAFRQSCINGHLHIAKWLLQIAPTINIRANKDEAFLRSRFPVTQWLLNLCDDYCITQINGMLKSVVIPNPQYKDIQIDEECGVCYEVSTFITNCNHVICLTCFDKLLQPRKCPLCREIIISGFTNVEDSTDCSLPYIP